MQIELRDYQSKAFDEVRRCLRDGARSVLVTAPTGSGKTVLASALMEMVKAKGNRANFVVDRLSLVNQTSQVFDSYGLPHGVIQSNHTRRQFYQPIQVCSIQTLSKRGWPQADVDVIDEAHVLHEAHKKRIKSSESIVIGLTATPFTRGLGKYFDSVVNVTSTRQLIEQGFLSPYRIFACVEPDMSGVRVMSTGEWDSGQASSKALQIIGDVVEEYIKHGEGRKFICSAVDTRHVEELARQFLASGINVATYTYKDKADDRVETVEEFKRTDSSIRGLITVTAASRGFDVPDVSCIIMARPLRKSLAEHIQLLGRGLRIHEGKTDCLVLDHSGNCVRFFDACESFFDAGVEGLNDGKAREKRKLNERTEREPVKCPSCRAIHSRRPFCPSCGHEYPKKDAIAHVPGTLKELIAGGHQQALTQALWPQICGYVLSKKTGDAARKQALAIYKDITGQWPRARFESTESVEPSIEVLNKIRASQIRYAYRRDAYRQGTHWHRRAA